MEDIAREVCDGEGGESGIGEEKGILSSLVEILAETLKTSGIFIIFRKMQARKNSGHKRSVKLPRYIIRKQNVLAVCQRQFLLYSKQ